MKRTILEVLLAIFDRVMNGVPKTTQEQIEQRRRQKDEQFRAKFGRYPHEPDGG